MNEMVLTSLWAVPPGNFRYKHPISGWTVDRHAWNLLRMDVTAHCEANGYPPISDEEIQQQICEGLGPVLAKRFCTGDGVSVRGVDLSWREIWAGTKVLASFIVGGRETVDRNEAERRAAICAPCSRNVTYTRPCGGDCPELADLVESIVGGAGTTKDPSLGACAVCSCSNKAQVWVAVEHLKRGVTEEMLPQFPDYCWKKAGILALQAE